MAKVGSSSKFCVVVCMSSLLWYLGDPLATLGLSAKFGILVFKASLLWYWGWRSIGQSKVIFQVLCIGMQVISALVLGGPLDRLGLSAKFGVLVFKASLLWYLGRGPLAKIGSSSKFCVVVFKASLLWYLWGSIGQNRVICQDLCSGIQGISALVPGGSIGQI